MRKRPDLIVDSITLDPLTRIPTVTIKNIGGAAADLGDTDSTAVGITGHYRKQDGQETSGSWGSVNLRNNTTLNRYLAPGAILTSTGVSSSSPDAFSLTVKVDYNNKLSESNENNNEKTVPVPKPDLIVDSITFDPITLGTTIVIKNIGGAAADLGNSDSTAVGLSGNWYNAEGRELGGGFGAVNIRREGTTVANRYLAPGATLARDYRDLPSPSGAASFVAKVDTNNKVAESNENNNERTEYVPKSDLTITDITFDPITRGPTIIVKNTGGASADLGNTSTTYVNLSGNWKNSAGTGLGGGFGNTNIRQSGGVLGDRYLAPGATLTLNHDYISAPSDAATFVAKVDAFNKVAESNENNNERTVPVTKPDLIVDSITLDPLTRIPTVTIKNIGGAAADLGDTDSTAVGITGHYRKQDGQETSGSWGSVNLRNNTTLNRYLAPGAILTSTGVSSSSPDAFSLTVKVDYNNKLSESNENNNEKIENVSRPDLIIESAAIDTIATGTFLNVVIKNIGSAAVPLDGRTRWMASFRNAQGNLIIGSSGGGYILDQGGILGPNQVTGQTGFELPQVPVNAKTIRIVLDDENKIVESDEKNNEKTIPVLLPDLIVATAEITRSNNENFLGVTVKNIGDIAVILNGAAKWFAYYKNDQDQTIGGGFGGSLDQGGILAPGQTKPAGGIQLPTVPAGAISVLVKVDDDPGGDQSGKILEKDETNNTKQIPIPIPTSQLPDLVVTSFTFSSSTNIYTAIVKNTGASAADLKPKNDGQYERYVEITAFFKDAQDKDITSSSYNLQAYGGNSLASGDSISIPVAAGLPQATAVLLQVDKDNIVSESNEENNESQHGLFQADLAIDGVVFASGIPTIYVKNIGGATADLRPNIRDGYDRYVELLVSWEKDGNAMSEGGFSHNLQAVSGDSLAAGGTIHITTPAPPVGATSMKVVVDSDYVLPESNEDNNTWTGLVVTSSTKATDMINFDDSVIVGAIEDSLASSPSAAVKPPPLFAVIPCRRIPWTKNICEDLSEFFTPDLADKTKLRLKFANEEVIQANKLLDKGKFSEAASRLKDYESDLGKFAKLSGQLQKKKPDVASDIAEKALEDQLRHALLFDKFERKFPKKEHDEIKTIKQETLTHINGTLGKLSDIKIQVAISEVLQQSGSPFMALRNGEVLKRIEKNAPESAKDVFIKEEEETAESFRRYFKQLPKDQKKLFPEYLQATGGDEALNDVLKDLKLEEQFLPEGSLPPGFSIPEFKTFEQYLEWVQKFFESGQFQELLKEIPQGSEEFPSQTEPTCPDTYDSVCGTDNYTYNNECEAKEFYGVAVAYKGECKVE